MTIDEAIILLKFNNKHIADLKNDDLQQLAEWMEKLQYIENIILKWNADWYNDEDNGIPDNEILEAIFNACNNNGFDIPIDEDYIKGKKDGYNKGINDYMNKAIEIVKQEAEKIGTDTNVGSNGWIPCSSGVIPRANGWYLVTNELGVVQEQRWSANHWEKLRDNAVIAWRELPEPYQPKGDKHGNEK